MPADRAITPPTLARQLGVGVHRVLGWIRSGELAAINVGDGASRPRWRITSDAIAAFLRRRAAQPAPTPSRRQRRKPEYTEYF